MMICREIIKEIEARYPKHYAMEWDNVGPGLNLVGPVENFAKFSDFSKIVFCVDMLIGRLEIFPFLMLFSPSLWSRKF